MASEYRLGTVQAAQFHNSDTMYHWGSFIKDDGSREVIVNPSSTVMNYNLNSVMPREYIDYRGGLFNWYTSTVESGSYAATDLADDSICPSGWMLPPSDRSTALNKSWNKLMQGLSASSIRQYPYNMEIRGFYKVNDINLGTETFYATSNGFMDGASVALDIVSSTGTDPNKAKFKGEGDVVRCIQRDYD